MFGSGITFRNWSPEYNKSGGPTHVNKYDAVATKSGSGLDREGMILIALMSGGDYIPEGIPGCGPKTACEAARAGFGAELCKISRKDKVGLNVWREKLAYELHTNESGHFKRKHGKLDIPDDFPNIEVLGYYTHPCISPADKVLRLRNSLQWDQDLNLPELRTFTAEAFDWTKLGGAKKFIRNLAPALLVREMRFRGQNGGVGAEEPEEVQEQEAKLVKAIHGKRTHKSTDDVTELRISFVPHNLVPIDLDAEEPDDDIPVDSGDEATEDDNDIAGEAPTSPSKKRAPPTYDPTQVEKIWLFETWAKVGIPLKVQDWEESFRNPRKYLEMKHAAKDVSNASKPKKKSVTKAARSAMPKGALDRFTRVTKASVSQASTADKSKRSESAALPISGSHLPPAAPQTSQPSNHHLPPVLPSPASPEIISLLSSPAVQLDSKSSDFPIFELPSTVTKRRRSPLRRTKTDTAILDLTGPSTLRSTTPPGLRLPGIAGSPSPLPSPSHLLPAKRAKRTVPKKPNTPTKTQKATFIQLSSPARQAEITSYFSPSRRREGTGTSQHEPPPAFRRPPSPVIEDLDLTASSPPRLASIFHREAPDDQGDATLQPDRNKTTQSLRPGLQELHPNLVDLQADQRRSNSQSKSSSQERTLPTSQGTEMMDLTGDLPSRPKNACKAIHSSSSTNSLIPPSEAPQRLQHFHKPPPPLPIPTASRATQLKRQAIRVRDSLDGAFAIEEVDLSQGRSNVGNARARKVFRMSEVGVLDLTGD
jgi:Holliday junction resolvase YEN1